MEFYTDVSLRGSTIYLRGKKDGRRVQRKIDYKPYLFLNSKSEDTKYRSLYNRPVDKINFDSVYEARDFMKRYAEVDGVEVYGLDKFAYTFINDFYPGTIDFDQSQINIGNIDIETESEGGFPTPPLQTNRLPTLPSSVRTRSLHSVVVTSIHQTT